MSMTGLTTTELALIIGFVAIVFAGIATLLFLRKRRSARLRSKFGGAEYAHAMKESGNRRHAEAALEDRTTLDRYTPLATRHITYRCLPSQAQRRWLGQHFFY